MKERDIKIGNLYKQGWKAEEIAAEVKCSIGTVYNALKRLNQKTRGGIPGTKEEIKNEVVKRYLNLESINQIKNEMGITQYKINQILTERNIKPISTCKRNNPNLKEDYFLSIDTPEKAYWIGWLITDGCMMDKDSSIQISLQSQDKYILNLLEKDLGVENKVKIFNKKYYRFYLSCKELYSQLNKYGLVQNKTFTINIPEIREDLYPALLRGCFDGDGEFSIMYSRGREEIEFSFTGNLECVTRFNNLISSLANISPKNITHNNSIYRVRWSNKQEVIKLCKILYKDSGEHKLIRKYNKYLHLIGNTEVSSEITKGSETPQSVEGE